MSTPPPTGGSTPTGSGNRTELLPLFPLSTVLVPGMALSLHVFEPRYRQLVSDLLNDQEPTVPVFGVVALRAGWEVGNLGDVHEVGTTARVTDVYPHGDGRCELSAVGERRFVIEAVDTESQPYLVATVRYLGEADGVVDSYDDAAVRRAWAEHLAVLEYLGGLEDERSQRDAADAAVNADVDFAGADEFEHDGAPGSETDGPADGAVEVGSADLSYAIAQLPSLPLSDRQFLLACVDTASRLAAGRRILHRETLLMRHLHAIPAPASVFRGRGSIT